MKSYLDFFHFSNEKLKYLSPDNQNSINNYQKALRLFNTSTVLTYGDGTKPKYRYLVRVSTTDTCLVQEDGFERLSNSFATNFGKDLKGSASYYLNRQASVLKREKWDGNQYVLDYAPSLMKRIFLEFLLQQIVQFNCEKKIEPNKEVVNFSDLWVQHYEEHGKPSKVWECSELKISSGVDEIIGNGALILTDIGRVGIISRFKAETYYENDWLNSPIAVNGTSTNGYHLNVEEPLITLIQSPSMVSGESLDDKYFIMIVESKKIQLLHPTLANNPWDKQVLTLKNSSFHGNYKKAFNEFELELSSKISLDRRPNVKGRLSSTLTIQSPEPTSVNLDYRTANICRLLTIAQRCPIVAPLHEVYSKGDLLSTTLSPMSWDYNVSHPLIENTATKLIEFVTTHLQNYETKDLGYRFFALVEYYWRAYQEETIEIKFIFASVFMEAFKYSWAKNIAMLPTNTNRSGLVREFLNGGRPASFSWLLNESAKSIGVVAPSYTLFDNRNALFHTGLSAAHQLGVPDTYSELKKELLPIYDQIDEIILLLLGFNGEVFSYPDSTTPKLFP